MLSFIFLALYGLYSFFKVNRAKSTVWMGANVGWLAGMGAVSYFHQNLYFGLGVVAAVAFAGVSLFVNKLPLTSNLFTYAKTFVKNVLFYPVSVFEEVYTYLTTHSL